MFSRLMTILIEYWNNIYIGIFFIFTFFFFFFLVLENFIVLVIHFNFAQVGGVVL
jgi:hypothetical protein